MAALQAKHSRASLRAKSLNSAATCGGSSKTRTRAVRTCGPIRISLGPHRRIRHEVRSMKSLEALRTIKVNRAAELLLWSRNNHTRLQGLPPDLVPRDLNE